MVGRDSVTVRANFEVTLWHFLHFGRVLEMWATIDFLKYTVANLKRKSTVKEFLFAYILCWSLVQSQFNMSQQRIDAVRSTLKQHLEGIDGGISDLCNEVNIFR